MLMRGNQVWGLWELSVSPPQFSYKSKTVLNKMFIYLKKDFKSHLNNYTDCTQK